MNTYLTLTSILLGLALTSVKSVNGLSICGTAPWKIAACRAHITYEDGTTKETEFYPEEATVRSCYTFGCHPSFCTEWRENIRNACKAEYEKKNTPGWFSSNKQAGVKSIQFEGCATVPPLTGMLSLLDSLFGKAVPTFFKQICSTESEAQEESFKEKAEKLWESTKRWIGSHVFQNQDRSSTAAQRTAPTEF